MTKPRFKRSQRPSILGQTQSRLCKCRLGAVPNFLPSETPALATIHVKQSWVLLLTARSIRAHSAKSNAISNGIKSRTLSNSQENGNTPTVPHSTQATSRGFHSGYHIFLNRLQSHNLKGTQQFIVKKSPFYRVLWSQSPPQRQTRLPVFMFPSTVTVCICKQINISCSPFLLHKW